MACFIAPMAEAIVVSVVKKKMEKKESAAKTAAESTMAKEERAAFSKKIGWLSKMLWGGSFLLAVEHVWHGEIVPWPPFLTAFNDPSAVGPMLLEIATAGVAMALAITGVWGVMLAVSGRRERRRMRAAKTEA